MADIIAAKEEKRLAKEERDREKAEMEQVKFERREARRLKREAKEAERIERQARREAGLQLNIIQKTTGKMHYLNIVEILLTSK